MKETDKKLQVWLDGKRKKHKGKFDSSDEEDEEEN